MTTVNEPEVEVYTWEVPESTPVCGVTWWKDNKYGEKVIDFECQNPVTHRATTHCGANISGMPHENRTDDVCERCLNEAMVLRCYMHDCDVVVAWSPL